MSAYSAGCATIMESLSAQLYVNALPEKTQAAINKDFSAHICRDADDVADEIKEVNRYLTTDEIKEGESIYYIGSDGVHYDNADFSLGGKYYKIKPYNGWITTVELKPIYPTDIFYGLYQRVTEGSRCIYVDKGNSNIAMSNKLSVLDHTQTENGLMTRVKTPQTGSTTPSPATRSTVTRSKRLLTTQAARESPCARCSIKTDSIHPTFLKTPTSLLRAHVTILSAAFQSSSATTIKDPATRGSISTK